MSAFTPAEKQGLPHVDQTGGSGFPVDDGSAPQKSRAGAALLAGFVCTVAGLQALAMQAAFLTPDEVVLLIGCFVAILMSVVFARAYTSPGRIGLELGFSFAGCLIGAAAGVSLLSSQDKVLLTEVLSPASLSLAAFEAPSPSQQGVSQPVASVISADAAPGALESEGAAPGAPKPAAAPNSSVSTAAPESQAVRPRLVADVLLDPAWPLPRPRPEPMPAQGSPVLAPDSRQAPAVLAVDAGSGFGLEDDIQLFAQIAAHILLIYGLLAFAASLGAAAKASARGPSRLSVREALPRGP